MMRVLSSRDLRFDCAAFSGFDNAKSKQNNAAISKNFELSFVCFFLTKRSYFRSVWLVFNLDNCIRIKLCDQNFINIFFHTT